MKEHGAILLHVHGVVALGGEVEEHELGMKAEFARIVALADSDIAQRFAKQYLEHRGHPLPIPILSVAECEMLALDQGCGNGRSALRLCS